TEPPTPAAALLPALDPAPMGWQDRDWYLPREHRDALFDRTGNVGPTVWWGGEVIGGWGQQADGTVVWRQLSDRGAAAAKAVDTAAAELTARLGGVRVTPRFRTPLERELASA
ncbi:DNA glycosylase AlkZ-like family protein, partial [Actinacidiphila rubida]